MTDPIRFPAINGIDGATCDVYPFGWTSGCTYPDGQNRGFTQEWFFDGRLGAWVSNTKVEKEYPRVNILGQSLTSVGLTYDAYLSISDTHFIGFVDSIGTFSTTVRFLNPPTTNSFMEATLIVDNPDNPTDFNIVGLNNSGVTGTVHMDRSLSSDVADGLTGGIHMWKIWTIDGGNNYYMYRANGFGRFWDDS